MYRPKKKQKKKKKKKKRAEFCFNLDVTIIFIRGIFIVLCFFYLHLISFKKIGSMSQ